ncbi:hypothetical protein NliqN6_4905 [Naganishia liquefaciens]|uniref:Rho-GAP domain-containing protein n=1 Tax=Naganishia liquefaciens TaxID=104408 RepID=A0A8H3TX85_9TREE|nr:hypothetical protein NliqN6_4905 [Naganishia liquefaciens]
MSSQRQQYASELSPNPQQRQQQYQEYSSYPSRSPNAPPYLDAPPRANSDSSSSLYSLSAYSNDIQGQPIQSPYAQTSGLQPLQASASTGSSQSGGAGQGAMNLDDYLEELRGAGDQRGLAGLVISDNAGGMGSRSAPVSGKASPANISGGSQPANRSNTFDPDPIPLSSSMSSTTSSLSQYSTQQTHAQGSAIGNSAPPIVPGSLPERDSSLQHIPAATDLAPPAPQMQKLPSSERERDLRRISSDSAGSNDTYSGTEGRDLNMRTPTASSMTGGQNVKQENLPSRLGSASHPGPADAQAGAQQGQTKIGMPGGTPLFDLSSAATFAGPPIDISDDPAASSAATQRTVQRGSTGLTSPPPQSQISHGVSSPSMTSTSTSNTSDYLTAASSTGTKAAMASMGGVAGLGIGMPQSGGIGSSPSESRLTFDEGLLRTLCDLDCALPLITERIKQSMTSCRQIAAFFRSRAELEDKYARGMNELVRGSADSYSRAFCKAGTFVEAFNSTLRVHDTLAQNRLRFAQRLMEMSEELTNLAKEGERLRKLHKEAGTRYEKNVQEAEFLMEKAKQRFDNTAEELERILVTKEGESLKDASESSFAGKEPKRGGIGKAMSKGLFKAKNPAQIQRQEDETRARMNSASEQFKRAVQENQAVKQEFFNLHLPKILRQMKECADELDMGCQYHMSRYAYLFETTLLADGSAVLPVTEENGDKAGLKAIVETIDNRNDFKTFMQNFTVARGSQRGPSRNVPYDDGSLPAMPPHVHASHYGMAQPAQQAYSQSTQQYQLATSSVYSNGDSLNSRHSQGFNMSAQPPNSSGMTFGVELSEQAVVAGTEIPKVVQKCTEAIEAFGLDQVGIYRLSGTTSKVQALKAALDQDIDNTNVMSDEWSGDINVIASVLKQWFRELPEPLLTHGLYQGFIEAARYENDRLRHIRLHEQVNELPDANYATLKHFMGHLDKIRSMEKINHMSVSNLSIVFGPTLLGAPPEMGSLNLEHMSFQCKAIETILLKYKEIFVEEEDTSGSAAAGNQ